MGFPCCLWQIFLCIVGVIAVAASVIPWILILVGPLLIIFVFLCRYFLKTSRDIKRLERTGNKTSTKLAKTFAVVHHVYQSVLSLESCRD